MLVGWWSIWLCHSFIVSFTLLCLMMMMVVVVFIELSWIIIFIYPSIHVSIYLSHPFFGNKKNNDDDEDDDKDQGPRPKTIHPN